MSETKPICLNCWHYVDDINSPEDGWCNYRGDSTSHTDTCDQFCREEEKPPAAAKDLGERP